MYRPPTCRRCFTAQHNPQAPGEKPRECLQRSDQITWRTNFCAPYSKPTAGRHAHRGGRGPSSSVAPLDDRKGNCGAGSTASMMKLDFQTVGPVFKYLLPVAIPSFRRPGHPPKVKTSREHSTTRTPVRSFATVERRCSPRSYCEEPYRHVLRSSRSPRSVSPCDSHSQGRGHVSGFG
jgi:hypothetical protein